MKTKLTLLAIALIAVGCSGNSSEEQIINNDCECETVTEVTYQAIVPPLETSNGQVNWVRYYKGTNDCTGEIRNWASSYEIMHVGDKKCD